MLNKTGRKLTGDRRQETGDWTKLLTSYSMGVSYPLNTLTAVDIQCPKHVKNVMFPMFGHCKVPGTVIAS